MATAFTPFSRMATQISTEIGSGVYPVLTEGSLSVKGFAAPYLPVLEEIEDGRGQKMPIVIKAGMAVGLDTYGYVVPATGYYVTGEGVTMTYTATDTTWCVIDLDNVTDAKMLAAPYTWTTTSMAAPSAGASTSKLPYVRAIGIAVTNFFANPQVLRRFGGYNFSNQDVPKIACGATWEVPVLIAGTAAAKNGDLLCVGNPTSNTFSAANAISIGRLIPLALDDSDGDKNSALMSSVIAKCLRIHRIDDIRGFLDKKDLPPGTNFQKATGTTTHTNDYANLEEHLRDAQELARTIGVTSTYGKWSLLFNLIVS